MQSGNLREVLVGQVLAFLLAQLSEGRTGNGNRHALAVDTKHTIHGVAVAGGDGGKQMHEAYFHRLCQCQRADFKRRNNIAHNVIYP